MNAVCRLTATSVPNQVIRAALLPIWSEKSYFEQDWPEHRQDDQADLDPLEREASRKIRTMRR